MSLFFLPHVQVHTLFGVLNSREGLRQCLCDGGGGQGGVALPPVLFLFSLPVPLQKPSPRWTENGNEAGGVVAGKRKARYSRSRGLVLSWQMGLKVSESPALYMLLTNSVVLCQIVSSNILKKYVHLQYIKSNDHLHRFSPSVSLSPSKEMCKFFRNAPKFFSFLFDLAA